MMYERLSFWAGLGLSLISLAALLIAEGAFLSAEPAPIALSIAGRGCDRADPPAPGALDIGLEDRAFFKSGATLAAILDLTPFAAAGCAEIAIAMDRPWRIFDNSPFYDPRDAANQDRFQGSTRLPGVAAAGTTTLVRNANAYSPDSSGGGGGRFNFVRLYAPDGFARTGADRFAARLTLARQAPQIRLLQSFGQTAEPLSHRRRHDISVRIADYARVQSVLTVVFATLLGIGVGAAFEARLILSAARRIEALKRRLRRE